MSYRAVSLYTHTRILPTLSCRGAAGYRIVTFGVWTLVGCKWGKTGFDTGGDGPRCETGRL